MTRGILSTLYFQLNAKITTEALLAIYSKFYEKEPFVRVLDPGEYPQTKAVAGTNYCDIGLEVDVRTNRVVVLAAIDNLGKGASSAGRTEPECDVWVRRNRRVTHSGYDAVARRCRAIGAAKRA